MGDADGDRPGLEQLGAFMQQWRQQHPQATLTEIEAELDRQMRRIRAEVLVTTAIATSDDVGVCPQCGMALVRRGEHERTLLTDGDEPLTLARVYATCPACGTGLFPPG
jgi:predicted RNA-binding Zn-ribbon protein involved in translation (DUF1610 family)